MTILNHIFVRSLTLTFGGVLVLTPSAGSFSLEQPLDCFFGQVSINLHSLPKMSSEMDTLYVILDIARLIGSLIRLLAAC